jgi:hypothetical protein
MSRKDNRYFSITASMLNAGVASMDDCRRAGGHTPRTACHAIFRAMLNAADVHPGIRVKRRRPAGRFKRSDFDSEGKRQCGNHPNGSPRYQYLKNFWYLK